MNIDMYTNKWLFYPYLKNNDLDYLIHPDDLTKVDSLGVVKGLEMEGEYLKIEFKGIVVRVKTEGVKRVFPSPYFIWGDKVCILSRPELIASVEDLFWHHKREEFLYYLKIDGKKKAKQYGKDELQKLSI